MPWWRLAPGEVFKFREHFTPTCAAYIFTNSRKEYLSGIPAGINMSDHVTVSLVARAQPGSSFGSGSTDSGGPFIKDTELENGLPLCIFSQEATVQLTKESIDKIPYLASKLVNNEVENGAVDGDESTGTAIEPASISLELRSSRMLEAYLSVLEKGVESRLSESSMFPLYSATATLGVTSELDRVESFVWSHLSSDRLLTAMDLANKHSRKDSLKRCYYWFRAHGAISAKHQKRRVSDGYDATDRAVNVAVSGEADIGKPQVLIDTTSKTLMYGGKQVPLSLFEPIISEANISKTKYFVPPSDDELSSHDADEGTKNDSGDSKDKSTPGAKGEGNENVDSKSASAAEKETKSSASEIPTAESEAAPPAPQPKVVFNGGIPPPPSTMPPKVRQARKGRGFSGLKRCYFVRNRGYGIDGTQTRFLLRSESNNELILAACTTSGKTFALSTDPDDFSSTSPSFLGHIDCTFTGTTFSLFDYGIPWGKVPKDALPEAKAIEHCAVVYDTNVLGRVPNSMTVVVPRWPLDFDANGPEPRAHGKVECTSDLAGKYKGKRHRNVVNRLRTRKPIWSDDLEAWTMDFHGRVKVASKKNFLLVSEDDDQKVVLLFGKVTKTFFSLDFGPPMTATQAVTVALSSFADKLMVT